MKQNSCHFVFRQREYPVRISLQSTIHWLLSTEKPRVFYSDHIFWTVFLYTFTTWQHLSFDEPDYIFHSNCDCAHEIRFPYSSIIVSWLTSNVHKVKRNTPGHIRVRRANRTKRRTTILDNCVWFSAVLRVCEFCRMLVTGFTYPTIEKERANNSFRLGFRVITLQSAHYGASMVFVRSRLPCAQLRS